MKKVSDKLIKVLLIEDNPGDARIIQEFLFAAKRTSFQIEVSERLSDGLEALTAGRFDVVLLDLSLPDSSGLDTLAKLHSIAQKMAIVVLTGLNDEDLAVEAVRKGAQDYLVKDQVDENLLSRAILYAIERKRAEEDKKEFEAQLQRSQKMKAIGTLAGGVAHDLNNILSGLVSYPELLLMDIPEDSPLRKPILTIQKAGEKAAAIARDLLALARRGVAVKEVVDLNNIVSEYLKSPEYERLKAYHPYAKFEKKLERNLLNILGSNIHLSKTIMNLISNAAEALPERGKVLISTENRYIDRPLRGYESVKEGDYVVLSVSDTGMGIPPEDLTRIFEPFYSKKVPGRSGTGLGMTVVWGTVKDYKGYIDVQSTEGKGTRFDLYFPATREEVVHKTPIQYEDYMGSETILVVDDVKEQREITSKMLSKLGYSVTDVSSGEKAIEYMKSNKVGLLVLDMIMAPGIDGLDTYKKIIELHPGQKAILSSGFSETYRVKEAQRLGAGSYIKKPYTIEKLGLAVKTELDK